MNDSFSIKNFVQMTSNESKEVLTGRNEEYVRKWMSSDRKISFSEHKKFIESLKCSNNIYLRVEYLGKFVGVYSLTNIENRVGVGGFWVTSYAREQLLSLSTIFNSINYVFSKSCVDKIIGYQIEGNSSASKLNKLLGFSLSQRPINADSRMKYLELTREYWESIVSKNQQLLNLVDISKGKNEK